MLWEISVQSVIPGCPFKIHIITTQKLDSIDTLHDWIRQHARVPPAFQSYRPNDLTLSGVYHGELFETVDDFMEFAVSDSLPLHEFRMARKGGTR
jgi:hypothetical protein